MKTSVFISVSVAALYWMYIFYRPSPQNSESNETRSPLKELPVKLFLIFFLSLFTGAVLNAILSKFVTDPTSASIYFVSFVALLAFIAIKTKLVLEFTVGAFTIVVLGGITIIGLSSLLSTCSSEYAAFQNDDVPYYRK